jgi:hypothetical protein
LTTRQPCQACGGRGGPVGPCPECGELPGVDLIGARGSVPEGEHRVTTPRTARRRAVAVIGIVVALVAMSMIWDGGGVADGARDPSDGDAEADEQGDDGSTTSTSRPRRATTTTLVRGSDRDPEALTEPIPGFEDQWLVVVGSRGAWQMSLAGGEPIRLGGVRDGESQFLVDGYLVGHQGGISLRDGHRWQVPQRSIETEPGMHVSSQGWVVGVTSTATIVVSHDDTFVELTSDGAVIREVLAPSAGSSWTHPRAVSGASCPDSDGYSPRWPHPSPTTAALDLDGAADGALAGAVAGRPRQRRCGGGRHHRREPHAHQGRAPRPHPDGARGGPRAVVMAGAGSNDTRHAMSHDRDGHRDGRRRHPVGHPVLQPAVPGRLGPLPAVAEATDLPVMLYDIPGSHRPQDRVAHDMLAPVRRGTPTSSASRTPPATPGHRRLWPAPRRLRGLQRRRQRSPCRCWRSGAVGVIGVATHWAAPDGRDDRGVRARRRRRGPSLNARHAPVLRFETGDAAPNPVPTKAMLRCSACRSAPAGRPWARRPRASRTGRARSSTRLGG